MSYTPSRFGQINGSGDVLALFLKVFSGEVLLSYQAATIFEALHNQRTITSGKSASFPKHGKLAARYHTPGSLITGQGVNAGEQVINIDDMLISDVTIANIDEAMNHYDVRSKYAMLVGKALAQAKDRKIAQTLVLAARTTTPTITGDNAGASTAVANIGTDASVLTAAISGAAQTLDEKNVAEEGRYCVLPPAQWYLLLRAGGNIMNRDYGGQGSYSTNSLPPISGIPIYKSNNVPRTVIAAASGDKNTYSGDFTKCYGIVANNDAVGTVRLLGLQTESVYQVDRQATLIVSKFLEGTGVVTPECAVELKST